LTFLLNIKKFFTLIHKIYTYKLLICYIYKTLILNYNVILICYKTAIVSRVENFNFELWNIEMNVELSNASHSSAITTEKIIDIQNRRYNKSLVILNIFSLDIHWFTNIKRLPLLTTVSARIYIRILKAYIPFPTTDALIPPTPPRRGWSNKWEPMKQSLP
jgi:hypothetical protein